MVKKLINILDYDGYLKIFEDNSPDAPAKRKPATMIDNRGDDVSKGQTVCDLVGYFDRYQDKRFHKFFFITDKNVFSTIDKERFSEIKDLPLTKTNEYILTNKNVNNIRGVLMPNAKAFKLVYYDIPPPKLYSLLTKILVLFKITDDGEVPIVLRHAKNIISEPKIENGVFYMEEISEPSIGIDLNDLDDLKIMFL